MSNRVLLTNASADKDSEPVSTIPIKKIATKNADLCLWIVSVLKQLLL